MTDRDKIGGHEATYKANAALIASAVKSINEVRGVQLDIEEFKETIRREGLAAASFSNLAVQNLIERLERAEKPPARTEDAGMQRLALEMAVDAAWSAVECSSVVENEGDIEWFNVGEDAEALVDEIRLLTGLKLAETHPNHPEWVREIAEL